MRKETFLHRLNEQLQNSDEYEDSYKEAVEMARKSLKWIKSLQSTVVEKRKIVA